MRSDLWENVPQWGNKGVKISLMPAQN